MINQIRTRIMTHGSAMEMIKSKEGEKKEQESEKSDQNKLQFGSRTNECVKKAQFINKSSLSSH